MAPRTRAARKIAAALLAAPLIMPFVAAIPAQALPAQAANNVDATLESKFAPEVLSVPVGATVTWTNKGGLHTVTGGANLVADSSSPIGDNQLLTEGATVQKVFDKEGTYEYFCTPHISVAMKGTIVVAAGGQSVAPSGSGAASATGAAQPQTAAPAPGSEAPAANLGGPAAVALEEELEKKAEPLTTFRLGLWALTLGVVLLSAGVYFITKSARNEE